MTSAAPSYCHQGRSPAAPRYAIVLISHCRTSCLRALGIASRSRRSYYPNAAHRAPRTVRNAPVSAPTPQATCDRTLQSTLSGLAAQAFPKADAHLPERSFNADGLRALRRDCRRALHGLGNDPGDALRRMRLQALADNATLGLRHVQVAAEEQRLREAAEEMVRPGARTATTLGGSLGLEAGLPGAVTLGTTLSASASRISTCFETLEYAEGSECGAHVGLHASAALPGGFLGIHARASAGMSRTRYVGGASVDDVARVQAREAVASPLRARLLQRLRGVFNPHYRQPADRIAAAARAAQRWQPLLPTLLGVSPATDAGAGTFALTRDQLLPAPMPLLDVWIYGRSLQLSVGANAGQLAAGADVSRTHQAVALEVPSWLPDTDLQPDQRRALADALHGSLKDTLGTLPRFQPLLNTAPPNAAERQGWLQALRGEFQHLQQLRTAAEQGPARKQAGQILMRFCADWNCRDLQRALQRLLELVHWLAISPGVETGSAGRIAHVASELANDIRASPALRQDARALRRVHACEHMYQNFVTRQAQASAAVDLLAGASGTAVQIAHTRQDNYNPLRTGEYIEASVTVSGAIQASALWRTLQQHVPALAEADAPADFNTLLHDAVGSELTGSSSATLAVRFFQPDFQKNPGFKAAAAGLHLQQITCRRHCAAGGSLSVPIAVPGPGGATLAASLTHESARPLREDVFCSSTLTALLLRYQSLLGQAHTKESAWNVLLGCHPGSLHRLAQALAQPEGSARAEAEYWLATSGQPAGTIPWETLLCTAADRWQPREDGDGDGVSAKAPLPWQRPSLQVLLDAVLVGVNSAQRRSSLRSPLQLHGAPLRMPRL